MMVGRNKNIAVYAIKRNDVMDAEIYFQHIN